MSLAIDVDRVLAVLLADGWHEVASGTFELDAYEYLWSGEADTTIKQARASAHAEGREHRSLTMLGGGVVAGVCSTGFSLMERRRGLSNGEDGRRHVTWLMGPVTSILAIRYAFGDD